MKTSTWWFWGAVALLAAAIGCVDISTEEVFIPALLLLGCGMVLGAWRPRRGWLAGIVLGLGVPAAHLAARWTHYPVPYHASLPATFLALIPAVVGGAAGTVMRTLFGLLRRGE